MNYLEPTIEYGIDYNIPRKISLEPKQIETEQRRLEKLKKLKHFDEIISVLKHYISNFIPNPRKYENFLWFISCYPKPNVEFRLTIYWQEILTLAYSQNLMLILDTRRITKKSAFDIKSKYEEGNVIPMYVNRYERNQKLRIYVLNTMVLLSRMRI
ncbi:MAG: hypothetical protein IPN88_03300 [Bacteroidetes bacterium]|nr:hypothetical protein [Bacteroidota bacterium]